MSEEVGPRHRVPEESTSPAGGAPWRRGPRVAGRSSRGERRRVAAAAERSRLRRVLTGLAGFLVVAVGLVIGLGTLQIDEAAEVVGRFEDPFPAEEQRPRRRRATG